MYIEQSTMITSGENTEEYIQQVKNQYWQKREKTKGQIASFGLRSFLVQCFGGDEICAL